VIRAILISVEWSVEERIIEESEHFGSEENVE
jgi:hypothetical protein